MMKNKIEVAANVVVIVLAVVIGSVFLMDRFGKPGPGPNDEQGRVSKVWMGELPAAEEAEVIAAISNPPAAESKQQSLLRAPFKTYKPKS